MKNYLIETDYASRTPNCGLKISEVELVKKTQKMATIKVSEWRFNGPDALVEKRMLIGADLWDTYEEAEMEILRRLDTQHTRALEQLERASKKLSIWLEAISKRTEKK